MEARFGPQDGVNDTIVIRYGNDCTRTASGQLAPCLSRNHFDAGFRICDLALRCVSELYRDELNTE